MWFVFGALLTTLSGTGVYLYGIRTASDTPRKRNAWQQVQSRSRWQQAWQGIGPWRWPSLALLLAFGLLVPQSIAG